MISKYKAVLTLEDLAQLKSVKGMDLTIQGPTPLGTFLLLLRRAKRVRITSAPLEHFN